MNAARLRRLQYLEALLLLGVCIPGMAQVTSADGDMAFATYQAMQPSFGGPRTIGN
jgi:hypothetical protein